MKTVVLTGASRGIGHATAKQFSERGWRVITCSRAPIPQVCPFSKGQIEHLEIDFSHEEELEAGIEKLVTLLDDQPVHALVNNAGISPKQENGDRLDTLTTDQSIWAEVLQVNLLAPALLTRRLTKSLQKGQGAVVNVTSIAGTRVHRFAGPAYAASKAALSTLTRELASDLGNLGIRVNAVSPGEIKTEMLSVATTDEMIHDIPLHRLGDVEEVASAIYFLCCGSASYINGVEIEINGGQHV